jgi:hypothetical protein
MSQYRVMLADPLVRMGLQWPEGVCLVRRLEPAAAGMHWHLLSDPAAPAELEGREVAIAMRRDDDGNPVIRERHVIAAHLVTAESGTSTACCGVPGWDIHRADRLTADPEEATCGGLPADAPELAGAVTG